MASVPERAYPRHTAVFAYVLGCRSVVSSLHHLGAYRSYSTHVCLCMWRNLALPPPCTTMQARCCLLIRGPVVDNRFLLLAGCTHPIHTVTYRHCSSEAIINKQTSRVHPTTSSIFRMQTKHNTDARLLPLPRARSNSLPSDPISLRYFTSYLLISAGTPLD